MKTFLTIALLLLITLAMHSQVMYSEEKWTKNESTQETDTIAVVTLFEFKLETKKSLVSIMNANEQLILDVTYQLSNVSDMISLKCQDKSTKLEYLVIFDIQELLICVIDLEYPDILHFYPVRISI